MSTQMPESAIPVYEVAFLIRSEWQAHSMNNIGSGGTNRLYPRRQLLANGVETDACSGDILKHHHAALVAEYFEEEGLRLCPACSARDPRRAGSLADTRTADIAMAGLLRCPQCDIHGFFLTARKANPPLPALPGRSKGTLVDYSYALAEPETFGETIQLNTRSGGADGEDQMIIRSSCRSGAYSMCIRYKSVGIGVDTNTWQLLVEDESDRRKRHQCVLRALRDQVLCPDGARTAGMLPHLTGIRGAIIVRTQVGRPFMLSPLRADFMEQLDRAVSRTSEPGLLLQFEDLEEFTIHMEYLVAHSLPSTPHKYRLPLLESQL